MSIFLNLFRASTRSAYAPATGRNLTTAMERQRLANTMPGETGARAGSRYGMIV